MEKWEEEYERARGDKEIWDSFLEHPKWKLLKKVIQEQVQGRERELRRPLVSAESVAEHNVKIGENMGLLLVLAIAQGMRDEAAEEERHAALMMKGGEDESEA